MIRKKVKSSCRKKTKRILSVKAELERNDLRIIVANVSIDYKKTFSEQKDKELLRNN